jgi:alpha-tubulin suppressor-like RCC1 family protein
VLLLAVLLVVAGVPGGLPRASAGTRTITWDTRPDFENNASTTDETTTRDGVTTARATGSVRLPGPMTGVATGFAHTVGLTSGGKVVAVGQNAFGQLDVSGWSDVTTVAAGYYNTYGLTSDGHALATTGYNADGQANVSGWTDIVGVAAGIAHAVGLRSDGTVVATGSNGSGQCNVAGWSDIVAIAAGQNHTIGLKADGTVVMTGAPYGDVSGWTDIVAIAGGSQHTVGLKSDGTVVATGQNDHNQCDVAAWTDIVAISTSYRHTVGLKSDGTSVAVGETTSGKCEVDAFINSAAIAAGGTHTAALKPDGSIVVVGEGTVGQRNTSAWGDYVAAVAGNFHTLGLLSNGTVVAVGDNSYLQCSGITAWTDMVAVAGGYGHSVGLKSDGTVRATGRNTSEECETAAWTDVVAVEANGMATIGLRSNGTVVATGANAAAVAPWTDVTGVAVTEDAIMVGVRSDGTVVATGDGAAWVSSWTGITAVAAGLRHIVGLKSDGTVVAAGRNFDGECEVTGWSDIVAVAAGSAYTLGLKSDGTVVAVGWNGEGRANVSGWSDVVSVSAGVGHSVGLKSDGTILTTGDDSYGQRDTGSWISLTPAGPRSGTVGGGGSAVGLRAQASSGFKGWTRLDAVTSALRPGEAIKFAVRVSDDGQGWSAPLGSDGQPIDWTSGTGNYLGRFATDATPRTTLSAFADAAYLDIVVLVESGGVNTPELKSLTLTHGANDTPVAVADAYSTSEDTPLVIAAPGVLANDTDADGDALTAWKTSDPAHGALALASDGSYTYTPAANWFGTDSFTYRASDGVAHSSNAVVTITVTPVVDASSFAVTSVSKTLATYGASYTFAGTLQSDAVPLADKPVVLQRASGPTGPWSDTSVAVQTAQNGTFALTVKPVRKTYYRARFAADADYTASVSGARYCIPRAWVGTPVAPKTMKRSKAYLVTGSLKPVHAKGSSPVRIYKYKKVGKKWKSYGYVKAKVSNYKGYSKYSVKMKLTSKGTWRLQAQAPADSGHAKAKPSGYDYVTVK